VTSQNEIREAREAMLRGLAMDPTAVADPAAALAALQQAGHDGRPFQLVLIETLGPRVDGFALAKKIQQAAMSGRQKIIMITSAGERGDAARCREVGLSGYLTLPLNSAELDEAVSAVLAGEPEPGGQMPLVTRHWLRERRVPTQRKGSTPCES
jgi:CheY-like chemotaxis protein